MDSRWLENHGIKSKKPSREGFYSDINAMLKYIDEGIAHEIYNNKFW